MDFKSGEDNWQLKIDDAQKSQLVIGILLIILDDNEARDLSRILRSLTGRRDIVIDTH